MATFEDLFGSDEPAGFRPKWNEEGDAHLAVMTGEPFWRQQKDWTSKKYKFMVQQDGKWGMKLQGDFEPDKVDNSFPLQDLVFPVKWEDGSEGEMSAYDKEQIEAVKTATKEFGQPLGAGVTVGKKLVLVSGKRKHFRFKFLVAE